MKLELKHLSPYLPYGLKIFSEITEENYTLIHYNSMLDNNIEAVLKIEWYKPILRPLSDLTKEITETECGNPIHLDMFDDDDRTILELKNPYKYNDILTVSVNAYNYLLKNHFDVFGLIQNNLAIDINTLK